LSEAIEWKFSTGRYWIGPVVIVTGAGVAVLPALSLTIAETA
jgi:hypothetical protein